MVSIPPELQQAYVYVANLFQVRPEWLVFPNIITVFIFPLIMNFIMFWIFLEKVVKIFPGTGMNFVIAGIISFLMLPYNGILGYISPAIIGLFGISGTGAGRILIRILIIGSLYALNFFVLPWVVSLLAAGFRF